MDQIIGGLVAGWVINKLMHDVPQWFTKHRIEIKQDISKVPFLEGILHMAIRYAEQFKATNDGPARFQIAKSYAITSITALPIPAYIKVNVLKVLPDLLQKAFDSVPPPDVSPSPIIDNVIDLANTVIPAIIQQSSTTITTQGVPS